MTGDGRGTRPGENESIEQLTEGRGKLLEGDIGDGVRIEGLDVVGVWPEAHPYEVDIACGEDASN